MCDYKATKIFHLRQHVISVHDNVKYDCHATTPSNLQQHVNSIHENSTPVRESKYSYVNSMTKNDSQEHERNTEETIKSSTNGSLKGVSSLAAKRLILINSDVIKEEDGVFFCQQCEYKDEQKKQS